VRLNTGFHQSFHSPSSSKEIPTWTVGYYRDEWQNKRGVVVWDDQTQIMECLWASDALKLLVKLRETETWRTEGIPIVRRFRRYKTSEPPKVRRGGKKAKGAATPEPTEPPKEDKPEYEDTDEERIRLMPPANLEFFAFLQEHEARLKEMAEQDKKRADDAMHQVYDILIQTAREHEVSEIDLSARPLPWVAVTSRIDWWCKSEINGDRIGQKAGSGKAPRARERDVSAIYS